MAKTTTTTQRSGNGPVYKTTTTRYDDGSSKSVTRTGGNILSKGKIVSITKTDKNGNSRTTKY